MIWVLIFLLAALVALLLLRIRVRLELSDDRRVLFAGLGRSGPEFDFRNRLIRWQLFGLTLRTASMDRTKEPADETAKAKTAEVSPPVLPTKAGIQKEQKGRRHRTARWTELISVLTKSCAALWRFVSRLLRSVVLEECEVHIQAGFSSPDVTGQVCGYYYAVLGAVPALAGRFSFEPDWTGQSLSARGRLSVALPLYALVYRLIVLIWQLPIRKLVALSRGRSKGEAHVE